MKIEKIVFEAAYGGLTHSYLVLYSALLVTDPVEGSNVRTPSPTLIEIGRLERRSCYIADVSVLWLTVRIIEEPEGVNIANGDLE